ncbi:hypothetical protein GCM10027444_09680 [Actinopolyspora lacussalsi]
MVNGWIRFEIRESCESAQPDPPGEGQTLRCLPSAWYLRNRPVRYGSRVTSVNLVFFGPVVTVRPLSRLEWSAVVAALGTVSGGTKLVSTGSPSESR